MISLRTALLLYCALLAIAASTLHGQMLYLALVIVGALAAKSALHAYRAKLDRNERANSESSRINR